MKLFRFTAKVWKWPGDGAWHFVTLPREYFKSIREQQGKGMVPIIATIGKTSWSAKLFPHIQDKSYLLALKKSVRTTEDVWDGEEVHVKFKIMK